MILVTKLQEDQLPLFFKLCSDHVSIEAIPRKALGLDLEGMKNKPIREHAVIMWTPHFVVLKNSNGQEITLRKDGRMVVRKASNEQVARDAAIGVLSLVVKEFRRV